MASFVSDNSPQPRTAPPPIADRLMLAVEHHAAGRRAEAEALYRGVLQESPRQPDALHLLGLLAHQSGRSAEAIDLIREALAVGGPQPLFHSNLAVALLALGRMDEAAAHCREALRLHPGDVDARHNLGVILFTQGRLDHAELCFREVLRNKPDHIEAHRQLTSLLRQQGRMAEVVTALREVLRLTPNHVGARNALGAALLDVNQPAAAEVEFREALRQRPDFAEAHRNLGMALRDQQQPDEAMECFRQALRLKPDYAGAHVSIGFLLQWQGRIDEARAEFQAARGLMPDDPWAYTGLGRLAAAGHYEFSAEEIRRMEAIAAQEGRSADERRGLYFTLARLAEKAGDYGRAFEHFRRGNDLLAAHLRRRTPPGELIPQEQVVNRLTAVFTRAHFDGVRSLGVDSEQPVFVVGMPRSGTTLAEQIIASHPRAKGAGELRDIAQLTKSLAQRLGSEVGYPECMGRLDVATARAAAEEYLSRLRRLGAGADRIVDKMPFNFQHLGFIATLFPRARVVHCVRDPIDTCLSCYIQDFANPMPFTPDLADVGQYFRQYERLMAHWARVLPLPVFELRYEELTADQEAVSRRLVEFCGLDWDPQCLRFHETERMVQTSSALQVRRPLYRSSVGRWKRYEEHLGPLLEALGRSPTDV
jgi:tetratricopeptide (TPR) repeat protein